MGKRGFVKHVTQLSAKLVVNFNLYHPNPVASTGSTEVPSLANAILSASDGLLTLRAEGFKPDQLPVNSILEALKTLYSYLEPVEQPPKLSPLTPRPPNTNVENQT
jgi:hypothetical protein